MLTRYQNQLELAVQSAVDLSGNPGILALEQIRIHLQTQQQAFLQTQVNDSQDADVTLLHTRRIIQEKLQSVEECLSDPDRLQDQLQSQEQQNTTPLGIQVTQSAPGTGGSNLWTTGAPDPGSGYGHREIV